MTTLKKVLGLIGFITFSFFLTGCFTAQKALDKRQYDKAIHKALKKVKKDKQGDKHILILEDAYAEAIKLDLYKIDRWTKTSLVNNWKKVLNVYRKLDIRQDKIETYLPLYIEQEGRQASFTLNDYKKEINVLKDNVSEYLYRTAHLLLDDNNKISSRKAYDVLGELYRLKPGYKDVQHLKQKAFKQGQNHILVSVDGRYGTGLPYLFERDLTDLNINGKNSKWVVFHDRNLAGMRYDYVVEINMQQVNVSPERIEENVYTDRKEVEDGWEYELDSKGNVAKDSLGNDIKKPKYEWITCDVIESRQTKQSQIEGILHIYDNESRVLIDRIPVGGSSNFNHRYATANGNLEALSKESERKIKRKSRPFPSDTQILEDAIKSLKPAIEDALEDRLELVMY